jgi:hypothetical protein
MSVSLQLLGDVSLDGLYCSPQNHRDFSDNCRLIGEVLGECDYRIANWEAPINGDGETMSSKRIRLATTWDAAEAFLPLGVNIVTLANNHVFDSCASGFVRTREFLDKNGIQHLGAGMTPAEAEKPLLLEKNGISFVLLNYASTEACPPLPESFDGRLNFLDEERVLRDIRMWKSKVDHVIVGLHWGHRDHIECPPPAMRTFGKAMIENGARLLYGGQFHFLLGYEMWKKGCIIYSLGNYCFSPVGMSCGNEYWAGPPLERQVGVACLSFDKNGITSLEWKYFRQGEKSLLLREDTGAERRRRHMSLCADLKKDDRKYSKIYRANVRKWDFIDYVRSKGGWWNAALSARPRHFRAVLQRFFPNQSAPA